MAQKLLAFGLRALDEAFSEVRACLREGQTRTLDSLMCPCIALLDRYDRLEPSGVRAAAGAAHGTRQAGLHAHAVEERLVRGEV